MYGQPPPSGNGAPARNPIKYNLAALRLAQAPNGSGAAHAAGPASTSVFSTQVPAPAPATAGDVPLSVLLAGLGMPAPASAPAGAPSSSSMPSSGIPPQPAMAGGGGGKKVMGGSPMWPGTPTGAAAPAPAGRYTVSAGVPAPKSSLTGGAPPQRGPGSSAPQAPAPASRAAPLQPSGFGACPPASTASAQGRPPVVMAPPGSWPAASPSLPVVSGGCNAGALSPARPAAAAAPPLHAAPVQAAPHAPVRHTDPVRPVSMAFTPPQPRTAVGHIASPAAAAAAPAAAAAAAAASAASPPPVAANVPAAHLPQPRSQGVAHGPPVPRSQAVTSSAPPPPWRVSESPSGGPTQARQPAPSPSPSHSVAQLAAPQAPAHGPSTPSAAAGTSRATDIRLMLEQMGINAHVAAYPPPAASAPPSNPPEVPRPQPQPQQQVQPSPPPPQQQLPSQQPQRQPYPQQSQQPPPAPFPTRHMQPAPFKQQLPMATGEAAALPSPLVPQRERMPTPASNAAPPLSSPPPAASAAVQHPAPPPPPMPAQQQQLHTAAGPAQGGYGRGNGAAGPQRQVYGQSSQGPNAPRQPRPYRPPPPQQHQCQKQPQQQHPSQQHPSQRRRGSNAWPPTYNQAPPPAHLAEPDPETTQRFQAEYAQQDENDLLSDDLKAQQASKTGTVGTLDEELCLSLIESHDVTFVVTDTGTGKSTRIPIALHKAHPDALVVNAQPRRTAAINLARRVAEVLDAKLGEQVGYSVRGEHIGDLGETKVMYVTTYSLFIYFLWHEFKEKLPFSYVIVDEFHERTPDVEVILLMLKLWLQRHPGAFKLVLCSATAQVEEWQSFFDGLTVGTYARSPIMYPVREYFIEDLQRLVGIRMAPIVPQESNNMVASEQMHQLILVCKQLLEYLAKNTATQDSVLVFMPGRTQVELMTTWIRDNLEESLEPIAWYRDVELSVIQAALARPAATRKKVYIATDIAEVSLTLPDVVFVIDSGTGKRPQVSEREKTSYAFPPLRLLWETTSNAQQRRGRVGRVQQGFYFSLLGREHVGGLRESENRIKNAVLTELVLHSLLITQKPFAFFQLCNEKPERGALAYSLHLLQDAGHIICKDDPLADAERVALDRQRTTHVMDSPWNTLIEETLTTVAATEGTPAPKAAPVAPTASPQPQQQPPSSQQPHSLVPSGAGTNPNDKTAEEDEDSVQVANPEAEAEAFQQCYYMTLRGVIAARSPVSVAAATNVFFGLLYGTPTLSMLAAAIESCKSPFHVPYTVNDRFERVEMVSRVSRVMQRYHGHLQSDLICSMEVILEYMSMQRDGLSEEAQEEWCQERSLSRTRVVDTLNLFAQMKEQVSSVLPFPDVTDIDVLTAQFNQNAELLALMLVASHTELAIQVQLDGPVAQSKGFVGHGLFFPLKCLKDESVPTVCPWERTKISVPLSLQTIQRKVLAVFATQVEPDLFALVLLVFSYKLTYTVQESGATPSYLMAVSHSGVRRTFQCDTLTAQQILQLRRIQCAQLRCMQLQVEERVKASESERLSATLLSANCDFGLPESAVKTPYLIPTVLQHALKLLVNRLKGSSSYTSQQQRRGISDFAPGTPYCKLLHGVEVQPPMQQSVLIHSSNGLSVVLPLGAATATAPAAGAPSAAAAAAVSSSVATNTTATAASLPSPNTSLAAATAGGAPAAILNGTGSGVGGVAAAPTADAAAAAEASTSEDEYDDESDRSSDSDAHVPTFNF